MSQSASAPPPPPPPPPPPSPPPHLIRASPAEVRVDESFKDWLNLSFDGDLTGRWERVGL
ncbi:MAG: hypothetical protein M1839_002380 [Geoglossum umbratile]|nr:MAG: hypothetical protein M1839_002380 [Geoglossum umbratile]